MIHHPLSNIFYLFRQLQHPRSTLFPYTTLFRSADVLLDGAIGHHEVVGDGAIGEVRRVNGAHRIRRSDELDGPVIVRLSLMRSEEHTSELQSRRDLVCRLLLEKKNNQKLGDLYS